MRKILAVLLLIAGVVVLCGYGAKHHAKQMEQIVADGASGAVASSLHGVKTVVGGRDIEVRGLADSAVERDRILETLDTVEGRRVVRDRMTVLASASPYTFSSEKSDKGVVVSGYVPTDIAREGIAIILDRDVPELELASGAPEGWTIAVQDGLSALGKLNTGRLRISGTTISLSGEATTPADGEAALAELKDTLSDYEVETSFDYKDDGKPVAFNLVYSASDGASVDGKVPAGLSPNEIAAALRLQSVSGDPSVAITGDPRSILATLTTLSSWLPEFETLKMNFGGGDGFGLTASASPGADVELLNNELSKSLGAAAAVTVEAADELPPEGTSRVNVATGETEVLTAGYWLPQLDFVAGYGQCREKASALLDERDVNFVTGSARLDARSLRVINAITSLVMKCVQSAGLRVEVGGHTDNQGDSDFNMKLSEERAGAVVNALILRGIPDDRIAAAGYGDTKPVADNDTEDGRAANRRVTLAFTQ